MQDRRLMATLVLSLVVAGCVGSAGCIVLSDISDFFSDLENKLTDLGSELPLHDEADLINVSYLKKGYYYFEDDNGRSFNRTLYEGDSSGYSSQVSANDWITWVQNLEFIKDVNDSEIFSNFTETFERGGGDCEDLAIMMARGLHDKGFDTCIIVQKTHVVAGINKTQVDRGMNGIKKRYSSSRSTRVGVTAAGYYPIEATTHWGIGEYDEKPLKYEKIYVLGDTPGMM